MVEMMAKSITKGIPNGYKKAMQMVGLTLPASVGDSNHSILQPEPIWIIHSEEGSSVSCSPKFPSSLHGPNRSIFVIEDSPTDLCIQPGPCCSPDNRASCDSIITTDGLGQPFNDGTF
jgi:hypothetical protein